MTASSSFQRRLHFPTGSSRDVSVTTGQVLFLKAHIHIGETHLDADDPSGARDAWNQALSILEELGNPEAEKVRAKLAKLAPLPDGSVMV